jgi:phage gpG-like protein
MDNKNAKEFEHLLKGYQAEKLKLMRSIAAMALTFFKSSFVNQGFTDDSLQKWDGRKGGPRNKGRAVLVDRGILKRGIRVKGVTGSNATIGVDSAIKYATIHNQGGTIPITPKMRRFFWAMYFKFGGKLKTPPEAAIYWRNLALSSNTEITIPKRQFIGDSQTLDKQAFEFLTQELNQFFKVT